MQPLILEWYVQSGNKSYMHANINTHSSYLLHLKYQFLWTIHDLDAKIICNSRKTLSCAIVVAMFNNSWWILSLFNRSWFKRRSVFLANLIFIAKWFWRQWIDLLRQMDTLYPIESLNVCKLRYDVYLFVKLQCQYFVQKNYMQ